MRIKKILSLTLAVLMMVSSFAFALPNGSLVIDDQGYSFQYVGQNIDQVYETFKNSQGNVFFKDYAGVWSGVGGNVNIDDIPAVTYHNDDGTTTDYAAKDGGPVVPNEERAIVITNEATLVSDSDKGYLVGDNKHTYPVDFKVNTPDGKLFKGTVGFRSTAGVTPTVYSLAYSEETRSFSVSIPNFAQNEPDTISVYIIDSSSHPELKNKSSQEINLMYQGYEAGSVVTKTEYDVLVQPVNEQWADRVSVLISNVDVSQETALMDAIRAQLRVYSELADKDGITETGSIVSIIPHKTFVDGTSQFANYNFEALIEVPKNVPQDHRGDYYDPKQFVPNFYKQGGVWNRELPDGTIDTLYDPNPLQAGPYVVSNTTNTPYFYYPLIDNGLNYYEISALSSANVKLATKAKTQLEVITDNNEPELAYVYSNVEGLKANSIVVEFSEPVDTLTAENPEIYTINGKNLKFDYKYSGTRDVYQKYAPDEEVDARFNSIKLLDVRDECSAADKVLVDALQAHIDAAEGEGTFDVDNDPRRFVVIELTNRAAKEILRDTTTASGSQAEKNLLYVHRVFDVAGVSDHVDENMIEPVPFYFNYRKPEVVKGIKLYKHSPEQYNLVVEDLYETSKTGSPKFDLKTGSGNNVPSDWNQRVGLVLRGYGSRPDFFVPRDQYTVIPYTNDSGEDGYLIELKKDWTYLLDRYDEYHGRTLTACLFGVAYDETGNKVLDFQSWGQQTANTLCASIVLNEDVTNPTIESHALVSSYEVFGDKVDLMQGSMALEFSEPMQFLEWRTTTSASISIVPGLPLDVSHWVGTTSGAAIDSEVFVVSHEFTEPNVTASQEQVFDQVGADNFARLDGGEFYQQFNEFGIGVPSFEYVRINSLDDLTSQAIGYHGRIVEGSVDVDDYNCIVKPVDTNGDDISLSAGFWKLVVRQATDDVGNSIDKTYEIPFEVTGEVASEEIVNPYVLWAYAARADQTQSGGNDVIRILFSRKMSSEAYLLSSYALGGQQFTGATTLNYRYVELYHKGQDEDGEILYRDIPADKNGSWVGTLVTLSLDPSTFDRKSDIYKLASDPDELYAKMALQIKPMTAVDDGDSRTSEELSYVNNNGFKKYLLTFGRDEVNGNPDFFMVYDPATMSLAPFRYDMGTQDFRNPRAYYNVVDNPDAPDLP